MVISQYLFHLQHFSASNILVVSLAELRKFNRRLVRVGLHSQMYAVLRDIGAFFLFLA